MNYHRIAEKLECVFINIDDSLDKKINFLNWGNNLIGRSMESPIKLTEKSISRKHATVNYHHDSMEYKFTHINEHTGSFIKIHPRPPHPLKRGEVLEIGSNEFKVTKLEKSICELTIIMGMKIYL